MRCAELLVCVLKGLSGTVDPTCAVPRVETAVLAIQSVEPDRLGVPAEIVAAVMAGESCFDAKARGVRGEIGLLQLLRGGALTGAMARAPFRTIIDPYTNALLGTAYLARMANKCGGPPARWLGKFNGRSRCGRSSYAARVLARLRSAKKSIATEKS